MAGEVCSVSASFSFESLLFFVFFCFVFRFGLLESVAVLVSTQPSRDHVRCTSNFARRRAFLGRLVQEGDSYTCMLDDYPANSHA